jgi:hypothetical protein
VASPPTGASPSPTHSASSSLLSLFGWVKQKRTQGKTGKRERRRKRKKEEEKREKYKCVCVRDIRNKHQLSNVLEE